MVKKLLFMMEKLRNSKGYTMLECIIVLMILCVCMLVSIPKVSNGNSFEMDSWLKSEIVCLMKDGYLHNQRYEIDISDQYIQGKHKRLGTFDGNTIEITPLMTVTKPLTITSYNKHREAIVKIWLGMGKVYAER